MTHSIIPILLHTTHPQVLSDRREDNLGKEDLAIKVFSRTVFRSWIYGMNFMPNLIIRYRLNFRWTFELIFNVESFSIPLDLNGHYTTHVVGHSGNYPPGAQFLNDQLVQAHISGLAHPRNLIFVLK